MSRPTAQRLQDILHACTAIESHLARGDAADDLVFDAIRIRLLEIGEAVKDIDPAVLAVETEIPWQEITKMRDLLAHRYFDTAHSIVSATARNDIPRLKQAATRLLARSTE